MLLIYKKKNTQTGQSAVQSEMAFKKVNHTHAFTVLRVKLPPQNMLRTQKHSFLFQHLLYWNRGYKFKGCQPDFNICILSSTPPLACHQAPLIPPILSQLAVEK